ncbi:MAG: Gfo/Idh/MocA family oxidoreductase [Candidatus Omnitrophica bacterium]|nr:Gfo/Idh/MocA family oxidoreductase [Candidatus Omnitrophota bacterium]MDD5430515.1 Gfo/Idh/MocA family oxidoreductase [Candidatus Omnitrophota bacterium]
MSQLNFAIIGFGKMGRIRYDTLKKLSDCRVTHISEPNSKIDTPEGIKSAVNPDEIFKDKKINAVIISTPNYLLKDYVIRALNSGKHVFCEKPPGRNIEELKEMITVEKKNSGLKLMFGFNHRHHESMIHAKKLVDSGQYGKILWLRGRYGKSVDENFFSNWRAKKELSGGGIFLDQGIHMLDLFLMMCGDFQEVKAYVSNLYWNLDIEDNVFAIFHNKEGQVASLHSTMTQWRHLFSFEIFLERGYITINGLKTSSNSYGDEVMSVAVNRSLPPAAVWSQEEDYTFHVDTSWEKELNIFIDSIRKKMPIPVGNTDDAYKLMRLVEKVYSQERGPKND